MSNEYTSRPSGCIEKAAPAFVIVVKTANPLLSRRVVSLRRFNRLEYHRHRHRQDLLGPLSFYYYSLLFASPPAAAVYIKRYSLSLFLAVLVALLQRIDSAISTIAAIPFAISQGVLAQSN